MKKVYILSILDDEDGYEYETLAFDNVEDHDKAVKVIEEVNRYWYSEECYNDEKAQALGFYEYLISQLDNNNLFNPIAINKTL